MIDHILAAARAVLGVGWRIDTEGVLEMVFP